jgi:peroxiredoxin
MTTRSLALSLAGMVLAGGSAAARADAGKALALGATAPLATTKMKSADGKAVSIADAKGAKGTLVVFTCNGCPYAKAWEERIVGLGNDYSKKGVGVLLVNANDPGIAKGDTFDQIQARAKDRGMQFPYAVDEGSGVARAFGASVTPEAFLFDKAGKLVYHGTIDDNHQQPEQVSKRYLKDALDAVITGKAPPVTETKSMGCGIKFKKVS